MINKSSETTNPEKAAQKVGDKANELQASAKAEATAAAETAKAKGKEIVEETQVAMREKVDEAKSSFRRIAEDRREQVATKVDEYRRAAKAAAEKLKDDDDGILAEHIENLSGKLGDVSSYLSNTNVDQLARDAGKFTRKNPEIMLGATVLVGFALARFLKASAHSHGDKDHYLPNHYSQPIQSTGPVASYQSRPNNY